MPRNIVSGDEGAFDRASMLAYFNVAQSSNERRKKMLSILKKALEEELTDTQRFCITEYYLRDRKMKDIAESLSVNPSTVTRHIKRAKQKLQHIASYY
ncbi:MAG: sigma-70 family RNA polymerase sigma factor [Ruminococcus sp.]|nr:sigma-70 family RNA polymerase sigma factor [Ruminococcus sp.]